MNSKKTELSLLFHYLPFCGVAFRLPSRLKHSLIMAEKNTRPHSSVVVDGPDRAPARAMLRAVGFKDDDFKKPQVAVASSPSDMTPCNVHLGELGEHAYKGINDAGGRAVSFNTITVTDGISMGTKGMRYSLVSRDVIADSIETACAAEGFDGLVAIGGCDKNMPGAMIAIARLNRPAVFVYGGTILPGFMPTDKDECRPMDIVSVFEAVGKHAKGELTDEELKEVEKYAIPGPGSCGGMYTANTMASAIEALGMSLPGSSAQVAIGEAKRQRLRSSRRGGRQNVGSGTQAPRYYDAQGLSKTPLPPASRFGRVYEFDPPPPRDRRLPPRSI
jgi:dihydroxy-acid dehydratase